MTPHCSLGALHRIVVVAIDEVHLQLLADCEAVSIGRGDASQGPISDACRCTVAGRWTSRGDRHPVGGGARLIVDREILLDRARAAAAIFLGHQEAKAGLTESLPHLHRIAVVERRGCAPDSSGTVGLSPN